MHRVRRSLRHAAMRRGVSGRLHTGESRSGRDAGAAPAQIRGLDGGRKRGAAARRNRRDLTLFLAVGGQRHQLGLLDDGDNRSELPLERSDLTLDGRFGLLQLGEPLLELVARAMDALDAFEAPAKLNVVL